MLTFIIGITYLVGGILTWKFPPKKINSIYGYRTTRSMKNLDQWNFAQKFSTIKMLQASFLLLITAIISFIIKNKYFFIVEIIIFLIVTILIIVLTERQLKKRQ